MRRSRKPSAFGAAVAATNRLFDSIGDELDLPEDREEWDEDDYEEERDAIGRRLVDLSGRMARLRNRLRTTAKQRDHFRGIVAYGGPPHAAPHRGNMGRRKSALTSNIAIESAQGTQAVVIPLEGGVYLVAEATPHMLQGAGADRVAKALQQSAQQNLLAGPGGNRQQWTEKL